jgi:hypothetical protein
MLSKGSAQTQFTLCFGKLDQLFFDLIWWWWHEVICCMAYSAKLGWKWIATLNTIKKSIPNKWQSEILPFTSPSWNTIWHKHKVQKDARLSFGRLFTRQWR